MGPVEFLVQWSWVSLGSEVYLVNETAREVLVTLRRRGYLGETSFVSRFLSGPDY